MTLDASGNGTRDYCNTKITGNVRKLAGTNIIDGTWTMDHPCGGAAEGSGRLEFSMSSDGRSFSGKWAYGSAPRGQWQGTWNGTCVAGACMKNGRPQPEPDNKRACRLQGRWFTDDGTDGRKPGRTRGEPSTWRISASGEAIESGGGSARGKAKLLGGMLSIVWTRLDGQQGTYLYEIDLSRCAGRGRLTFTAGHRKGTHLKGTVRGPGRGLPKVFRSKNATLEFEYTKFWPFQSIVRNGTSIRMCNRDPLYVKPFSLSRHNEFDDTTVAPGTCRALIIAGNPTEHPICMIIASAIQFNAGQQYIIVLPDRPLPSHEVVYRGNFCSS